MKINAPTTLPDSSTTPPLSIEYDFKSCSFDHSGPKQSLEITMASAGLEDAPS